MREFLERLTRTVVLVLLLAVPWFFGGVDGSTQLAISAALAASWLCICFVPSGLVHAWPSLRLPLLILGSAVLLGAVQLSKPAAAYFSQQYPAATAVARDFAAVPDATTESATRPLSLNPPSTRRELAMLILGAAAFAVGAVLFWQTRPMLWLLTTISLTAAAVALFGLLQKLSWNGQIYWQFSAEGGMPFGPFINRNNAAGYLEIGLASAAGLLAWQFLRLLPESTAKHSVTKSSTRRRSPRDDRWSLFISQIDAPLLCGGAFVFLIISGILASASRGSFVSLLLGAVGAVLIRAVAKRVSIYVWIPAIFILAAIGFIGWLGQSDLFYERVSTLVDTQSLQKEPRLAHWQVAWRAAQEFQPFGSGLGTYRFAYPRLQQGPADSTFYRAENQFLDALVTAGYVGLTLYLLMWLLLLRSVWRLTRLARDAADQGIAIAAALLLATQTVHACFDFAMYVPAHFLPFALLSGAFLRRANEAVAATASHVVANDGWGRRLGAVFVGLGLCGGLAWSLWELRTAWSSRSALAATRAPGSTPATRELKWLDDAIHIQRQAVDAAPDDGELRIRLAELYVARYAAVFRRELSNFAVDPSVWQWESPNKLHADAHLLARIQDEPALAALRKNRIVVENLAPALAEARQARLLCPLAPYGHMLVAKLCFIDESPLHDAFYLDRAERLVGGRADWLFEIGALHIDAARLERGYAAWRRCWELSSKHEATMIRVASGYLTPAQLLKKIVPNSPETIVRVAKEFFREPDQEPARRTFYKAALTLIADEEAPSAEQCRRAALCETELGNLPEAAQWHRRALSLDAKHPEWFFEAGELSARIGDWEAAVTQARQAALLAPDNPKYREQFSRVWNEIENQKRPQSPHKSNTSP